MKLLRFVYYSINILFISIYYIWLYIISIYDYILFVINWLQYKTEKDGVVETRVEQKITIQSDGDPIDHDRALAEAIQEATAMNPDMTVEKIEIQQQTAQ